MHKWAVFGRVEDGKILVPCMEPGCEAWLERFADGEIVHEDGWPTQVHGTKLILDDDEQGGVAKLVCMEIEKDYRPDEIDFQPGDIVLDVGAHVGVVSCYLAKKYPFLTIFAFEPNPINFERLKWNIRQNEVKVMPFNLAVTGDGRDLLIGGDHTENTGGFSMWGTGPDMYEVESITLPDFMERYGIERVKLLKLDCEGAEYEILTEDLAKKCDYIRGEFHRPKGMPVEKGIQLARMAGQYADVRVNIIRI